MEAETPQATAAENANQEAGNQREITQEAHEECERLGEHMSKVKEKRKDLERKEGQSLKECEVRRPGCDLV